VFLCSSFFEYRQLACRIPERLLQKDTNITTNQTDWGKKPVNEFNVLDEPPSVPRWFCNASLVANAFLMSKISTNNDYCRK
jgi:hypothetical protein